MASTSRDAGKIIFRAPIGLRDDLKIRAIRNRRTLASELLYLIERGLAAEAASERTA